MIIYDEPAETYRARKAVSAGMIWTWIDECPYQAWYESSFNPEQPPSKNSTEFDIGTATHLLILEDREFAKRCTLIAFKDYKTQAARDLRDQAYAEGLTPLLPKDLKLVYDMGSALRKSEAADLLFGEGKNEVTYTWEITQPGASRVVPVNGDHPFGVAGDHSRIACKARADRITPNAIIDLKTATSASPSAFERAMDRDGHHVRASWYLSGLQAQITDGGESAEFVKTPPGGWRGRGNTVDYIFIVVAKAPPHLVSIYSTSEVPDRPGWFHISEESIDKGRLLYKKALAEFRRAREANLWPVYSGRGENKRKVSLPAYRLNQIYAQERAGEFDEDADIPY